MNGDDDLLVVPSDTDAEKYLLGALLVYWPGISKPPRFSAAWFIDDQYRWLAMELQSRCTNDCDPWRAILRKACSSGSKSLKQRIIEACRSIIELRIVNPQGRINYYAKRVERVFSIRKQQQQHMEALRTLSQRLQREQHFHWGS